MATPEQIAALHAVVPAAQQSARQYGVPASVTLAQWIFESSWGKSQLAVESHNCFGVKCVTSSESYMEMPTAEYQAGRKVMVQALFAKYNSAEQSFEAHARLLASSARYRPAMASSAHPEGFCVGLQRCGYSTSPTYAQCLIGAIREYNLTQYDVPAPSAQI